MLCVARRSWNKSVVSVNGFFFSSRRRHTSSMFVTGVQTCALPISERPQSVLRPSERPQSVLRAYSERPQSVLRTSSERPQSVLRASSERPQTLRASSVRPQSVFRASSERPQSVLRRGGRDLGVLLRKALWFRTARKAC